MTLNELIKSLERAKNETRGGLVGREGLINLFIPLLQFDGENNKVVVSRVNVNTVTLSVVLPSLSNKSQIIVQKIIDIERL